LPPEPGVRGVFESPAVFGSALGKRTSFSIISTLGS
jgi:hypothetical protein